MTFNYEDFEVIIDYLTKLNKGIDPYTNIEVEDTILRSSKNRKMINIIIDLIIQVQKDELKVDRRQKLPFYVGKEQKNEIEISIEPISISAFVYRINKVIDNTIVKKIRATQITNWLLNKGYLTNNNSEKSVNKISTPLATDLGINLTTRTNNLGEKYTVCLYNENAQRFIIEHLNEIVMQS